MLVHLHDWVYTYTHLSLMLWVCSFSTCLCSHGHMCHLFSLACLTWHIIPVWIQINLAFVFCNLRFSLSLSFFLFFFGSARNCCQVYCEQFVVKSTMNSAPVRCSRVLQISLFSNFFPLKMSPTVLFTHLKIISL